MRPDRAPADNSEGLSVFRLTYSVEGATRLLVDGIWWNSSKHMSAVQPAPEHIRELLVCKMTQQDIEMAAAVRIKLASKARLRCVIM